MTTTPATISDPTSPQLSRSDRLQPVILVGAIAAGLAIGSAVPQISDMAATGVSVAVFGLIALVMLNVNPRNVRTIFHQRRFLTAAVGLNFVVNPVIAWALGTVFLASEPDLRIGLVLFMVTPCIGWYLIFTEIAGGDTELGVGLLGGNVVLQVLLLPVYLALFVGDAGAVDLATLVESIVYYLLAPAALAGAIRWWWAHRNRVSADEQRRLRVAEMKTAALVLVVVSMFASQAEVVFEELDSVANLIAPMTLFFCGTFATAMIVGRRLGLDHERRALLVFTTTSRNSEASLAIAATAFASPLVGLTVAVGPLVELPLLIMMARFLRAKRPQVSAE